MRKEYNNQNLNASDQRTGKIIVFQNKLDGRARKNRCIKCNRLLFKGDVVWVEIKCKRCGVINTFKSIPAVPDPTVLDRS